MAEQDDDPSTSGPSSPSIDPTDITADPRKFSEYVLVPGHRLGTDAVFVGLLGYRPLSDEDAAGLAATYIMQARARVAEGAYAVGHRDGHGQWVTIEIVLRGARVRSGWVVRTDGTLTLATPFTGFSR